MTSEMLTAKTVSRQNPWIIGFSPVVKPRLRLICLPYAGGSASIYRQWHEDLPRGVEVCAIQLPGRERRFSEPAFTRMDAVVDALEVALGHHLDLPFALFGHSMGASIAFELAGRLEARGRPPLALMVSGRRAPHVPPRRAPIHALTDSGFVNALLKLNGTPAEVLANEELMALMLPLLRADFKLIETHTPPSRPPLNVPVIAFGGTADREAGIDDVREWSKMTRGTFQLHQVTGDHFYINTNRRLLVGLVARELERRLSGAVAGSE